MIQNVAERIPKRKRRHVAQKRYVNKKRDEYHYRRAKFERSARIVKAFALARSHALDRRRTNGNADAETEIVGNISIKFPKIRIKTERVGTRRFEKSQCQYTPERRENTKNNSVNHLGNKIVFHCRNSFDFI